RSLVCLNEPRPAAVLRRSGDRRAALRRSWRPIVCGRSPPVGPRPHLLGRPTFSAVAPARAPGGGGLVADQDVPRARRLWQALEPLHAVTYFAPEPQEACRELGT